MGKRPAGAMISTERRDDATQNMDAAIGDAEDVADLDRGDREALLSSMGRIRGVLNTGAFRRWWIALGLSSLGDWLGLLAISALATTLAHSYQAANFALGGVLILRLLPAAVFGPVAGAFADRFDRRHTMVVTDILRVILFASIPIVGSLAWLFIAQFLIECASLFWTPAKDASVPNLVRKDQIEAANQLSLITTYGISPIAAGAVFSILAVISKTLSSTGSFFSSSQVNLALYLNAATFVVSAATVYTIREISERQDRLAKQQRQAGLFRLFVQGWSFVKGTPMVRGLVIGMLGAFAAGGFVIGTGKIYAQSLGGGNAAYGLLFGAVFTGLGLGMALGPRIARDMSRRRLFGLAIVFAGGSLLLTAVMPHLALSMLTTIGVGFGAGVAYLAGMTLLGSEVEDEVRGRTFAFVQSMVRVVLILSLAVGPFLVGVLKQQHFDVGGYQFVIDGTRFLLAAGGFLAIAVGIVSYRQMDDRRAIPLWADLKTALRGDTSARRRLTHEGILIAFEGGEGAGKSTQIPKLAQWLKDQGFVVTVTYEPGATEFGGQVRKLLLDPAGPELTPRAEALLFAADRAHHVTSVIRPALAIGGIVVTDRYMDASLAYQGAGRSLSIEELRRVSRWAADDLEPDLTVLLDIDPIIGLERAHGRSSADRLEQESLDFHRRVRTAFRDLAESDPRRYVVLDATKPVDEIAVCVQQAVAQLLVDRSFQLAPPSTEALNALHDRIPRQQH